jgi:hypothetical protein
MELDRIRVVTGTVDADSHVICKSCIYIRTYGSERLCGHKENQTAEKFDYVTGDISARLLKCIYANPNGKCNLFRYVGE